MMNNDWSIWSRREDTRIRCKAEVFRETCCPFLVSYGRVGIHPCFSRTRLWVWTSPQGCASADMRAVFKALSKPFSLMIVGSYTIQYIGDDHHPLREIPLTNQYKGRTFRVLNTARSAATKRFQLWITGGTTGLQTKPPVEACGTLSPKSAVAQQWTIWYHLISESAASQEMRCRFLAMPILLARCSDNQSQRWPVWCLMVPVQLQLRRNISGRSRLGSRKDQRGEKPGAVCLKPWLLSFKFT